MSEGKKESRAAQTSIPRLKSSTKLQIKGSSSDSISNSANDGKQTAAAPASKTNGNGKQKDTSETPGKGLSLQGPFNPKIVGNVRKHGDKRKKPEYNGGKFLTSVKSYEDLACKRSTQSEKEKQKYQWNFSSKAETKFAGGDADEKKPVHFTAKGPAKTKGYRELKKSEEELQKKVLHLEVSMRDLDLLRTEEVTSLTQQLSEANEKAGALEGELSSLKKEYVNCKVSSSSQLEEQEAMFLKNNQKLQEKVDSYIKKLQENDIDPVTLERLEIDQQEIEAKRQNAVEQALSLKQKLKELSEKNRTLMENIQNCMDGSG